MSLVLENIAKSFGAVEVLKDISVTFEAGEVTAIVGDNGAGKSTLLKMITGYHWPDKGRVLLYQDDLSSASPHERRDDGIEMVFQDLALAGQQDVVANLFMGREMVCPLTGLLKRRQMAAEAKASLAALGITLPDLMLPVGLLSSGQQQAVAIARAALFAPRVLLLDEPTAALAPKEVDHVLELIRTQKKAGRIVILVSHRFNDVFAVSDRILVLKHGQIGFDVKTRETNLAEIVQKIVG